jgi:hypothetical protein
VRLNNDVAHSASLVGAGSGAFYVFSGRFSYCSVRVAGLTDRSCSPWTDTDSTCQAVGEVLRVVVEGDRGVLVYDTMRLGVGMRSITVDFDDGRFVNCGGTVATFERAIGSSSVGGAAVYVPDGSSVVKRLGLANASSYLIVDSDGEKISGLDNAYCAYIDGCERIVFSAADPAEIGLTDCLPSES